MMIINTNGDAVYVDGRFIGDSLVFFDRDGSVEAFLDEEAERRGELTIMIAYGEYGEETKEYKDASISHFHDLSIISENKK